MRQLNKVTTGDIYKPNKSPNWYYCIHYMVDGKRMTESKSTGLKALKKNKKEAESIRDNRVRELEEMYNLVAKDLYFHDFLINWYANAAKTNLRLQSYKSYKYPLRYAIDYFTENRIHLVDLRPYHLNQFYQYLVDETDLSANTITKKVHMIVSKALRYACESDLIQTNPASFASQKPATTKPDTKMATADQVETIMNEVKDTMMFAPVWLCAKFGLRRGEAVGLRWENVDLDNGKLRICETMIDIGGAGQIHVPETKNSSSKRVLFIHDDDKKVFRRIRAWQEQQTGLNFIGGFVCTDESGNSLSIKNLSSKFTSLCKRLGYDGVTLHSLRHFFASTLIRKNISIAEISKALGHSNIKTTVDKYGHLMDEGNIEIAEKMGQVVNV